MTKSTPVVYIFHGEDEFAISQAIAGMQREMGDQTTADMNTTRLDGRNLSLDELYTTAASAPFMGMGDRRLVVVNNLINNISTPELQNKLIGYLEKLPPTARLVFVENKSLPEKTHWLISWAKQVPQIVYIKHFALRSGKDLADWIQNQAKQEKGTFTIEAAELLAELAGNDPRMAYQEMHKLLAYVNYQRPVEADDVRDITPDASVLENFALANALRERNPRKAIHVIGKELERTEPYLLVGSIAYQFRTLLNVRDILDRGGNISNLVEEMKIKEGYARYLLQQAQIFTSVELIDIYRRLLKVDEDIKTSQMDGDVALQCFITEFTTQ